MHLESCRQSEISSICINDLLEELITKINYLRFIISVVVSIEGSEGVDDIEGMLVHAYITDVLKMIHINLPCKSAIICKELKRLH